MLPGCSVLTVCVMNRRWPCLVPWTVSFIALIDDAKKTDVSLKSKDGQKYNFSFGEWHCLGCVDTTAAHRRMRDALPAEWQRCGMVCSWLSGVATRLSDRVFGTKASQEEVYNYSAKEILDGRCRVASRLWHPQHHRSPTRPSLLVQMCLQGTMGACLPTGRPVLVKPTR